MKNLSSPQDISHYPVMLDEVLKICNPENGGDFIDCTFGYGDLVMPYCHIQKQKSLHSTEIFKQRNMQKKLKKIIKIVFLFIIKNLVNYQKMLLQKNSIS